MDCCCGLEARKAMVSLVETQPPSAAQSAAIPRIRMTRDSPRPIAIQEQPEGVGKRAYACNHTVKIRGLLKTKDVDCRDKPGHDGESIDGPSKQKRPGLSTRPLQTLIRRFKLRL